jgi:hypothetical protein
MRFYLKSLLFVISLVVLGVPTVFGDACPERKAYLPSETSSEIVQGILTASKNIKGSSVLEENERMQSLINRYSSRKCPDVSVDLTRRGAYLWGSIATDTAYDLSACKKFSNPKMLEKLCADYSEPKPIVERYYYTFPPDKDNPNGRKFSTLMIEPRSSRKFNENLYVDINALNCFLPITADAKCYVQRESKNIHENPLQITTELSKEVIQNLYPATNKADEMVMKPLCPRSVEVEEGYEIIDHTIQEVEILMNGKEYKLNIGRKEITSMSAFMPIKDVLFGNDYEKYSDPNSKDSRGGLHTNSFYTKAELEALKSYRRIDVLKCANGIAPNSDACMERIAKEADNGSRSIGTLKHKKDDKELACNCFHEVYLTTGGQTPQCEKIGSSEGREMHINTSRKANAAPRDAGGRDPAQESPNSKNTPNVSSREDEKGIGVNGPIALAPDSKKE